MISVEQIKQFAATVVIPPLAGALSTWLFTSVHFLSLFHVTADQTAKALVELAVFGVTAGLAWLASHHILLGNYTPGAKSARASRRVPVATAEFGTTRSVGPLAPTSRGKGGAQS